MSRSIGQRITDALLFDLSGRSGFGLLDSIDRETMDELRETWESIIDRELAAGGVMGKCPETSESCDRMCQTMCHRRSEELATLRAKVAELEKDRERLDWLLDQIIGFPVIAGRPTPKFDRATLDAAMSARGEDAGS